MRPRVPVRVPSEIADFVDEIRRLFLDLGRSVSLETLAGQCSPPLDVYEHDDGIEIVMDLPGVTTSAVRVVAKGHAVLIAGDKPPRRPRVESSFHLVEREFGHFARAVRLESACDTSKARAYVADGELHITLPKIDERRGRAIPISVRAGKSGG